MSIDNFETDIKIRNVFIATNIVDKLPKEKQDEAKDRATRIVNNYVGRDLDALSVLSYAAEQDKFDEFAQKLEAHYTESLQFVHPQARKASIVPGARRAEVFFLNCYDALGIKPQK